MFRKWLPLLSTLPLFSGISEAELQAMLNCIKPEIKQFEKNQYIAWGGEAFTGIGIVLFGNVIVSKENIAGDRVILSILEAGGMFGEMAAFSGVKLWPATIIAQGETTVTFLPSEKIVGNCPKQCAGHKLLILNMMKILAKKALLLNQKLDYLTIKSVRERIVTFLLEQFRQNQQQTFMLPMNRNQLADFLNITRPSLSRELGRLRDEGLIDFHRASVRIKNLPALMNSSGREK